MIARLMGQKDKASNLIEEAKSLTGKAFDDISGTYIIISFFFT